MSKLKHLIEPSIKYTYIPYVDQDDLPGHGLSEKISEQSTITYSLDNTLIGKMIGLGEDSYYKELIDFELSQSYNFESSEFSPSGERRYFSDIEGDLKVRLSENIFLRWDARYDVYEDWFNERNLSLNIKDRRGDNLWFDYRYQRDLGGEVDIESLNTKLSLKITDRLDFTYRNRYSMTDDISLESDFTFNYRSQCWSVLLNYNTTPGYEGEEGENKFMIIFSLYGLGPVARIGN
jgi:LPS-assembly protein